MKTLKSILMKKKILLLALAGGFVAASCKRTYQCKDQAGIITGEVKAYSQSKATSLCQANNPNQMTAIKK